LNLPYEPINVVAEDPINPNVIYVGTDHGVYASIDGGKNFYHISKNFPFAPVHDLVVHPEESELVVATHGRSIYKANVKELQKLTSEIIAKKIHIFEIKNITYNKNWGNKTYTWGEYLTPELKIPFYSNGNKTVELIIKSQSGVQLFQKSINVDFGLNYFTYDLTTDYSSLIKLLKERKETSETEFLENKDDGNFYLIPGNYVVEIIEGKEKFTREFKIEERK
jgi:hypothetical protein